MANAGVDVTAPETASIANGTSAKDSFMIDILFVCPHVGQRPGDQAVPLTQPFCLHLAVLPEDRRQFCDLVLCDLAWRGRQERKIGFVDLVS